MAHRRFAASVMLVAALAASPALADPGAGLLLRWTPDPVALAALLALGWAYGRGAARQYGRAAELADWKPALFYLGLFAIFLAMLTTLAALARDSAFMHQVQGALLRVVAPLFLLCGHPQRLLYTGMPKPFRRGAFARLWRDGRLNRVAALLATPLVAGVLNIAVFLFWLLPATQDAAVRLPLVGFAERVSLLAVGALYFGVLFDARDPDLGGTRYGPRMLMLVSTALVMVVMGVAMTAKPILFYSAYPPGPRFPGFAPLDDEATAGFVIWAWVSLVYLASIIFVFVRWNAAELRAYARARNFRGSNAAALLLPETAEELWLLVTPKNRRVALGLAFVPFIMMGSAIGLVVTLHYGF